MSNQNPPNFINLKSMGVLGAGMMGAEIALCFALNGAEVLLKDVTLDLATSGKKRIEGIATPEDIDKAVKLGLGHPVGVFQLQDIGGLDLELAVSNVLYEEYGERFKPSPVLKRKVAANQLGRKTKRGWFDYQK